MSVMLFVFVVGIDVQQVLTVYMSNCLPFASTWVHPGCLVVVVLLISLVFCVVLLCVFTFLVPCCDVRYDFRIKTMFSSSLPPVVCRRAHVLITFFVFACVYWWFFFVFLRPASCVPVVAGFSGLFIFWLPLPCSLTLV